MVRFISSTGTGGHIMIPRAWGRGSPGLNVKKGSGVLGFYSGYTAAENIEGFHVTSREPNI